MDSTAQKSEDADSWLGARDAEKEDVETRADDDEAAGVVQLGEAEQQMRNEPDDGGVLNTSLRESVSTSQPETAHENLPDDPQSRWSPNSSDESDDEERNLHPQARERILLEESQGHIYANRLTHSRLARRLIDERFHARELTIERPGPMANPDRSPIIPSPLRKRPRAVNDNESTSLTFEQLLQAQPHIQSTSWAEDDDDEQFFEAIRRSTQTSPIEDSQGQNVAKSPAAVHTDVTSEREVDQQVSPEKEASQTQEQAEHVPPATSGTTEENEGSQTLPLRGRKNNDLPASQRGVTSPVDKHDALRPPCDPEGDELVGGAQPMSPGSLAHHRSNLIVVLEKKIKDCERKRASTKWELSQAVVERDALHNQHEIARANWESEAKRAHGLGRHVEELQEEQQALRDRERGLQTKYQDRNDQVQELELVIDELLKEIKTAKHNIKLIEWERDGWKICADTRKPAWEAEKRRLEAAEQLTSDEVAKARSDAGTQTKDEASRRPHAKPPGQFRHKDDMRWPEHIRRALITHMVEWINATHLREGGATPLQLQEDRMKSLIGNGTTPFGHIVEVLHQEQFYFREDRLAQDLQDWLWKEDPSVDLAELMYFARGHTDGPSALYAALREIQDMRMQLQAETRDIKLDLQQTRERAANSEGLLAQVQTANIQLFDNMETLQKRLQESQKALQESRTALHESQGALEESEEALRAFEDSLGSDGGREELEELQTRLNECHKHGKQLEARNEVLQHSEEALKQKTEELEHCDARCSHFKARVQNLQQLEQTLKDDLRQRKQDLRVRDRECNLLQARVEELWDAGQVVKTQWELRVEELQASNARYDQLLVKVRRLEQKDQEQDDPMDPEHAQLKANIARLRQKNKMQDTEIARTHQLLQDAMDRCADLEQQQTDTPPLQRPLEAREQQDERAPPMSQNVSSSGPLRWREREARLRNTQAYRSNVRAQQRLRQQRSPDTEELQELKRQAWKRLTHESEIAYISAEARREWWKQDCGGA